jgi:hypothetical protein
MLDQVLARELRVPARDLLKRIRNTGLSAQQTGLVLQSGDTERLVDLIGEPLPFEDTPGAAILVLREVRLESPRALSEIRGVPRDATIEALDRLAAAGVAVDYLRLRACPFGDEVEAFLQAHRTVFVLEQNRDAQMRSLLMIELDADPRQLVSILHYNGLPVPSDMIVERIGNYIEQEAVA